jgi:predicted Na+-dependent transporter
MIARRFTILCLLMMIFGMGLAMLVAEKSRPIPSWQAGLTAACFSQQGMSCGRRR